MTIFHLRDRATWHGYPCTIIGRTLGEDRVYTIKLDDGSTYKDVPERQIQPAAGNVVELEVGRC